MAEARACLKVYWGPDKNSFSFEKRTTPQGASSGEYGGCDKTATSSDFRSFFTISDVCSVVLSGL